MTDTTTQKRVTVETDWISGPHIMVPVTQADDVKKLLDSENVPYSMDDFSVALDDEPAVIFFDLGRKANPSEVQALLDARL
jgi:hypothetical protein